MRYVENIPFRILVTSFSKKTVVLQKLLCIAYGTGPLDCIVQSEVKYGFKPTLEASFVGYMRQKIARRKSMVI